MVITTHQPPAPTRLTWQTRLYRCSSKERKRQKMNEKKPPIHSHVLITHTATLLLKWTKAKRTRMKKKPFHHFVSHWLVKKKETIHLIAFPVRSTQKKRDEWESKQPERWERREGQENWTKKSQNTYLSISSCQSGSVDDAAHLSLSIAIDIWLKHGFSFLAAMAIP